MKVPKMIGPGYAWTHSATDAIQTQELERAPESDIGGGPLGVRRQSRRMII